MIFTGFVYVSAFLLQMATNLLPSSNGFPQELIDAFTTMGSYAGLLNTLLPLETLAIALGILISIDLAIFGFKSFKWIVSHLPFVGGRG